MYVRICQAGLKIPLKNEIPAAGQIRRKKVRRDAALFSSFLLLYPKSPAESAVKTVFEIRNIKIR